MFDYLNDMDFLIALDKLNIKTHYAKIILLSFDEKHQIWHCPCHQSIFDCYGKLIEGPCLKDMNKQK